MTQHSKRHFPAQAIRADGSHAASSHPTHAGEQYAPTCVCGWVGQQTPFPADLRAQFTRHVRADRQTPSSQRES